MKKVLITILILVVMISSIGCQGTSGEEQSEVKIIKIAHGANESYHMHKAWLKFKEELEAKGDFKVEIYPSSQFGNDTEMIESVKTGDLTMAVPPSSFLIDEAPEMALIELPYVFPSRQSAVDTLAGEWGQSQLDKLQDNGMVGLGYLENGLRHLTNSKKAVKQPEDLQGLKLRTMQVPAHVYLWNDLGSTAEGAPFSELYTNLSTGVFDGQENPIAHIYSQKFYEVQDYITLTGHVYTAYVPLMDINFWENLNEDEKVMIKEAFNTSRDYQLSLIDEVESKQLEEIINNEDYPTEVIELSKKEKEAFIEAAQPTLKYYREELGKEAFDKFTSAVEQSIK